MVTGYDISSRPDQLPGKSSLLAIGKLFIFLSPMDRDDNQVCVLSCLGNGSHNSIARVDTAGRAVCCRNASPGAVAGQIGDFYSAYFANPGPVGFCDCIARADAGNTHTIQRLNHLG